MSEPRAEVALPAEAPLPVALAQPALPAPWADARSLESNGGAWLVRFRSDPDPIPTNEPFSLDVWVLAAGSPNAAREDVQLSVDASMPEHGHGMSREPKITREEHGRFRVRGMLFHMPGRWELDFDVTRGAVTERAQLDLELE